MTDFQSTDTSSKDSRAGIQCLSHDLWLAAGGAVSAIVMVMLSVLGRPVNDDYWAFGTQDLDGFWGSLGWYYTEFQGNVTSWFFILLHEQQWYAILTPFASAGSILLFFLLLGAACWGGMSFLGVSTGRGWRRLSVLAMASLVAWLSLESVVGPNSTTALYYMASTIVHVWPWLFALIVLGLVFRSLGSRGAIPIAALSGFLAGSLAFVEAALIGLATAVMALWIWKWNRSPIQRGPAWSWTVGLGIGVVLQAASPATWGRSGGLGSEAALTTNVQAVERLLAVGESRLGTGFVESILGVADIEVWARALVPVAVVGDLVLRPGLLAVVGLVAWWMTRNVTLFVPREELRKRLAVGLIIVVIGGISYSGSGALYAYAGRHVAGLALVVTLLAAGFSVYYANRWKARPNRGRVLALLSSLIVGALAVTQVWVVYSRAQAWDEALVINRQLISEGRLDELISVRYQAGLSSSGLRDHDGSSVYIEWLLRIDP